MKRILLGLSLLGAAAALGGCPIYPSQGEYQVCSSTECFSCPDPNYSSACTPWPCQSDGDCPSGYSCDPSQGVCDTYSGGADGGGGGDCSVTGCPSGQVCEVANGTAQCVTLGGDASTEPTDAGGNVDSGSNQVADSGTAPVEASTGNDGATTVVTGPCNSDATCGGNGEKCINGQCTTQINLCSDGSQCAATGSACVDGVCVPQCSAPNYSCPTGLQCNLTLGVCQNASVCSGSGQSTCLSGLTCVDSECVVPCTETDAGGVCPTAGQVCVNGGCLADQHATFNCTNDGQGGMPANTCSAGAICIHHDCVPGCGGDGGASCAPLPNEPTACESITIETGTYSICAAAGTEGSQCDPAQGHYCSGGQVCVDGNCKQ